MIPELQSGQNVTATGRPPVTWNGHVYHVKLDKASSGGAMGVVDGFFPYDSGPPKHIHDDADELFFVVSGEIEVWTPETGRKRLGAGGVDMVARGVEHAFRVTSKEGARLFVAFTPAGFESFFEAMAAENLEIPRDMARIEEIAKAHHLRLTGAPLEAE